MPEEIGFEDLVSRYLLTSFSLTFGFILLHAVEPRKPLWD